jgi:hypothetical protein
MAIEANTFEFDAMGVTVYTNSAPGGFAVEPTNGLGPTVWDSSYETTETGITVQLNFQPQSDDPSMGGTQSYTYIEIPTVRLESGSDTKEVECQNYTIESWWSIDSAPGSRRDDGPAIKGKARFKIA